jgi:membrane-bound lytic murein transglycosylase A
MLLLGACAAPPLPPEPAPLIPPAAPVAPANNGTASSPTPYRLEQVSFTDLPGWLDDDLREALPALRSSCAVLAADARWRPFCTGLANLPADDLLALRALIERSLVPARLVSGSGSDSGLITGYYEPSLRGSRKRVAPYLTPLYRVPEDLVDVDLAADAPETRNLRLRGKLVGKKLEPYPSRAELEATHALKGKELVWVDDPVDAFFLQVQGSGRVTLFEHGKQVAVIRLAYADQNGQPYRSIGKWLIDQHELGPTEASMQGIKDWIARHPDRQSELFNVNPSVVFFKEEPIADPAGGPRGALNVPLTPERSIAVDPRVVPLGVPVYLSTTRPNSTQPFRKLVLAQDTGSAIVVAPGSAVRADVFFGSGDAAGDLAGRMKQQGQQWLLLPR